MFQLTEPVQVGGHVDAEEEEEERARSGSTMGSGSIGTGGSEDDGAIGSYSVKPGSP